VYPMDSESGFSKAMRMRDEDVDAMIVLRELRKMVFKFLSEVLLHVLELVIICTNRTEEFGLRCNDRCSREHRENVPGRLFQPRL